MTLFKKIFRKLRSKRFSYEPLVTITLDGAALAHNYRTFQSIRPQTYIAPVLKSNAYGHGLVLIARKLNELNPPFFVVDSYYEALILKNEGIQSDVLVLGYIKPENIFRTKEKGVVFTITTFAQLEKISANLKRPTRFHLKVDTGMHRQGIAASELLDAIACINKNKNIVLEGVCSHFADADTPHSDYMDKQIALWNEIRSILTKKFSSIRYTHIEATAGTAWANKVSANVCRVGIGLYGINPASWHRLLLRPVLTMESVVVGIKQLKQGDCVGYNATYCAPRDMVIATIPVGYYEGIDRRLSNKGCVYINNIECPIVGRVSMNMINVDVSDVPNVQEGDTVEIISTHFDRKNSIVSIANLCETIPYEILVHIPEKIRRVLK